MPPSESQSSNSAPEIGAAAAKVTPLRILVVDDDLDLARGTCRLMEQAGYETIIVGTGIGALQAVRDRRPHIVLLDRQLPDMDGLDVCRQIKADPATAGVLVIMVSGHHVQNEDQLTALSTGADGYITRPINNPELRVRIDAFARIARLSLRLTEENAQRQLLEADLENRVRARTAELLAVNQQLEAAQRAAFSSMREAQRAQEELTSSNRQLLWEIAERQRAEAVLRDGEAQVRAMMDATLESIFMMDAGGTVLIANDTVAKRLGVTLGQLVGHNMFDFLPPEVAVRRRAEVEQVLSTGKPVRFEDERLGRWLDHQINPVLDGSGRVTRVVAFGRDITERKQAEEQLQEHERQLATLLRNLPGMAYRCRNDQNWTMSFVSYGCLELTGYAVEDLLNNQRVSYASLIVAEDQARVWEQVQRAVREQRSFQLHYRIQTATGKLKWVWERGGGVFAADGTLEALEGIIADITERKLAEEQLLETNAYLENLINYANAPIIVWDPQFRITRFNHAFEALTGRTEAEVLGQSLELLFPPALAESSMVLIRQTLTGQRWEVVEIKIQHRDCSERTVLWNSATLFAPDGRTPMATIAQGQDITTRKSAEEALRESEWRFRDMMAKVQLVSATLDPEGNITFANECLLQLTGWRPEEILGRNWFEVFVPTEAEVRQVLLQGVSEGRVPLAYENEILTRGGERRLIAWSNALLRDARGGIAGIAGIGVDITERKQAEKKLRETNAYLENLINYANAPIIVWDPQFRITRFNHAFESLTGCTEVEVLGKSLEFLFPQALAASSMELIRQTQSGHRWEVVEIRIQHRDGSERTVLWNSATLFAPDGQTPLATIAQGQDITERQQREAEVRELLQQTQRDAHTKAELLKEVNHRVKNNLLAILGIALAEQRQLSAEEKPVAQRFTGNLRRRIEGLLEVHQMLSASLWAPVPVNQLAQQIIQSVLAATPASCQVKLVLQPSTVKASPRQASNLALVFNELATNTVKYALAQRTAAQVTFAAAATESLIRLEYRDDGPGYPPEVLRQERLSVGLMLIRDLTTETLRGQLTLANEAGAVTVLEIKTEEINRT